MGHRRYVVTDEDDARRYGVARQPEPRSSHELIAAGWDPTEADPLRALATVLDVIEFPTVRTEVVDGVLYIWFRSRDGRRRVQSFESYDAAIDWITLTFGPDPRITALPRA